MFELRALPLQPNLVGLRTGELGFGLQQVGLGNDACVIAVLRDLPHPLVAGDGCLQQFRLHVGFAQVQVIGGQFALGRQRGRRQVGLASRRAGARAFDAAAQPAPQVRLPACAQAGLVAVAHPGARRGDARCRRAATAAPAAVGAGVQRHVRKQAGALACHQRARLGIGSAGGSHVLVRHLHGVRQLVEHRVIEYRPPRTARRIVGRRCRHPVAGLLERGRQRQRRRLVHRRQRTGAEAGEHGRGEHMAPQHRQRKQGTLQ